ncbi:hypothetical protein FXO38_08396 [Capsicum annuum]|nr:hypothetical protein FXO38_08396 [Capsicum annuum]
MILHYHPDKANVVVDALSRFSMRSLAHVDEDKQELVKDIHRLANLRVRLADSEHGSVFVHLVSQPSFVVEIKEKQVLDPYLIKIKGNVGQHKIVVKPHKILSLTQNVSRLLRVNFNFSGPCLNHVQHRVNPRMGTQLPVEGVILRSSPGILELHSQRRLRHQPASSVLMRCSTCQLRYHHSRLEHLPDEGDSVFFFTRDTLVVLRGRKHRVAFGVQTQNITVAYFVIGGDGILRYQGRLCVSDVDGLREMVMTEAHRCRYTIHPNSTKMYHNLREFNWWINMKLDVAIYVAKCMVCQQVKVKHIRPEIVKLHGALVLIISNCGPPFSSHFWKLFQKGLGTRVCLSTIFTREWTDLSEELGSISSPITDERGGFGEISMKEPKVRGSYVESRSRYKVQVSAFVSHFGNF